MSQIHFGSLEHQERSRLMEDQKSDAMSVSSMTTRVTTVQQPLNRSSIVQILQFSEESQEARRRHDEMLKQYDLQKSARNIIVPTNDQEVKQNLRRFHVPICYFGEGPADRRTRLKNILARQMLDTGKMPDVMGKSGNIEKEQNIQQEQDNEYYIYEGSKRLIQIREEICQYSLEKANKRIEASKQRRSQIDPLEEEKIVEEEAGKGKGFSMEMVQFGDSSALTQGRFNQDGQFYVTSGGSGETRVWKVPRCQEFVKLAGHEGRVNDVGIHDQIIGTAGMDSTVRLWRLTETSAEKLGILEKHQDRINGIAFHTTGKWMTTVSHDKTWRFWDVEKLEEVFVQTGHGNPVYCQSLHPDGSLLFTGDLGGLGAVWDLRIGKCILHFSGHVKSILSSDFSSNGFHLATGSSDNTVRLWDLRRKNCFYVLPAHIKLISTVKFQPGASKFLTTCSYDSKIKFWSTKDWSLIDTLEVFESKLTSIDFTQNGQYMSSTSLERKWVLWKNSVIETNDDMIIE